MMRKVIGIDSKGSDENFNRLRELCEACGNVSGKAEKMQKMIEMVWVLAEMKSDFGIGGDICYYGDWGTGLVTETKGKNKNYCDGISRCVREWAGAYPVEDKEYRRLLWGVAGCICVVLFVGSLSLYLAYGGWLSLFVTSWSALAAVICGGGWSWDTWELRTLLAVVELLNLDKGRKEILSEVCDSEIRFYENEMNAQ